MTTFIPKARRIVFSGDFWPGSSGRSLADGFRQLGWAVYEVDLSRRFGWAGNGIGLRFLRRLISNELAARYDKELIDAIETMRPDVFLTIKGTRISHGFLSSLKKKGIRTALFYPDYHFDHPDLSIESLSNYDFIFTTKTFHIDWLREKLQSTQIHYVPHGYSDSYHWPLLGTKDDFAFDADVQYIGAHSSYKQDWLEPVRLAFPNERIRIYGERWKSAIKNSCLRSVIAGDSVYGEAYSLSIQSACINIAVHFGPNSLGWQDNVSTRTFEIPACRGFMLHIDNDEVREYYVVGQEIDVFTSSDELIDKTRFYLARPSLRESMIESAYRKCVPAYGYTKRAAQISKTLIDRL